MSTNMNVEQMLDLIEETLDEGASIPLSGGKHLVDVDKIRDYLDEVRLNLPGELHQARNIVGDRSQILTDANAQAEAIVKKAEERARILVSEQEIVKRAQQRAAEILTGAQGQAKELSRSMTLYCESILKSTEETLARSVSDIKNTRLNLRNAAAHTGRIRKQQ